MRFNWIRHLKVAAISMVLLMVVVVIAHRSTFALMASNMSAMGEGSREARSMHSPEALLTYLAARQESISIVAFDIDDPAGGLYVNADAPRATAGLSRLLVVAEYLRQVEEGLIDDAGEIDPDDLGTFALPGIASAAHFHMLNLSGDRPLTVSDVVAGMVQHRDPAAADLVMRKLGQEAIAAIPAMLDLPYTDAPVLNSGLFLAWNDLEARATDRRELKEAAFHLASAYADDPHFRAQRYEHLSLRGAELSLREQRALATETFPRSTAADYASLMARLAAGDLLSPGVTSGLRELLETTFTSGEDVEGQPLILASHGGSFPGLVSLASYVRREDGSGRVAVLLIEDLPIGIYYHLMQTGIDRGLQLRLLLDDGFTREARTLLSPGA